MRHNTKKNFFRAKVKIFLYKKSLGSGIKKIFFRQSINMTNLQQNEIQNKIEQSNKDINLLQYKLKKLNNEEGQISKMKNRQKRIAEMNKIHKEKKEIKRQINLLQGRVEQFKKIQILLEQSK